RLPADDPQRPELRTRERALLAAHQEAWADKVNYLCQEWEFRRGFVERITMTGQQLRSHGEAVFRRAPIQSLRLKEAEDVGAILPACPFLDRLTGLDLRENRLGSRDAEALARLPQLAKLRSLSLGRNVIGTSGAMALAVSPHLRRLKSLGLENNAIGATG